MHGKLLTRKNKGITMLPKQTADPIMLITKPVLKVNTIPRKVNGTRKKLR
jgi:predicted RecA/RadA family phage recombinase